MKVQGKKCLPKYGVEIPNFNQSEKNELVKLTIQSPIRSTKYIINTFNLSHKDAKYIVTHINKTYGQCNCCNVEGLNREYMDCPNCGALNFNWKAK
jgi:hypothetical protein